MQTTHPARDWCLWYTENSQNTAVKAKQCSGNTGKRHEQADSEIQVNHAICHMCMYVVALGEDSYMEIDTMQISGVTNSTRSTTAALEKNARLIIRERLLTDGDETAKSDFTVTMDGEDSGVDLISRSVAKGRSYQEYHSVIKGNCR